MAKKQSKRRRRSSQRQQATHSKEAFVLCRTTSPAAAAWISGTQYCLRFSLQHCR